MNELLWSLIVFSIAIIATMVWGYYYLLNPLKHIKPYDCSDTIALRDEIDKKLNKKKVK